MSFSEEKKYLYHLKKSPDDIDLRIGLMSLYINMRNYKKAKAQYDVIGQSNYNGNRKSELENNIKILQSPKTKPIVLKTAVSQNSEILIS